MAHVLKNRQMTVITADTQFSAEFGPNHGVHLCGCAFVSSARKGAKPFNSTVPYAAAALASPGVLKLSTPDRLSADRPQSPYIQR
jgi:hypothetical protein